MKRQSIGGSVLAAIIAAGVCGPSHAGLIGLWEFEDSSNLGKATIGSDATFGIDFSAPGTPTYTVGAFVGDGAVDMPKNHYINVPQSIGPNGGGSTYTSEYTLVIDLNVPSTPGTYTAILQEGGGDADYFIANGSLGVSAYGYVGNSSTFQDDTWYRLAISVDLGTSVASYLDGNLVGNHASPPGPDGKLSLAPNFAILRDNSGETHRALISQIALYDRPLSGAEVAALGDVTSPIPEPGSAVLLGVGLLALVGLRRRTK